MRLRLGLTAAAVIAGMAGGTAWANDPESAYIGIGGGAVWAPDQTLTNGSDVEPDIGWGVYPALGARWAGGWRGELEGAVRRTDADLGAASGTLKSSSLIVNVLKDFNVGGGVMPYVGVGVGAGRVKYDELGVAGTKLKDTGPMMQGILGLSFPVSDALEFFADYRYSRLVGTDIDIAGAELDDDYSAHQGLLGLRWTFWRAVAAPVAAPAPAPVAAPKDYVIYFEFDKSNITDAAGAVLDEIKTNIKPGESAGVVGHTDTSGSNSYNQGLSERRADSTASGLTSRGVTVDSVNARGETEPAVQTGDGVREPLNRRSTISIHGGTAPTQ